MGNGLTNLNEEILRLENISKIYKQADGSLEIIKDSSLVINKGELVSFIGPSGCGKTTLLQICGLLDNPTSGNVFIKNKNIIELSDLEKTNIRKNNIGFIFQFHHLLPEFSVLENVMLPSLIDNKNVELVRDRAIDILKELGLETKIKNSPYQLSGGERQRVAIARSIINNPSIILADEPTGNLDPENANIVFNLLVEISKKNNTALLMVSHNIELANKLDRTITIRNKEIANFN